MCFYAVPNNTKKGILGSRRLEKRAQPLRLPLHFRQRPWFAIFIRVNLEFFRLVHYCIPQLMRKIFLSSFNSRVYIIIHAFKPVARKPPRDNVHMHVCD